MRVWITRTLPTAQDTARAVAALGHEPLVSPVLEVRALPDPATNPVPSPAALAFTSRNAVSAWAALDPTRDTPAFCVGDATAAAARDAGFTRVHSASGDVHDLAALIRQAATGPVLAPGPLHPSADLAALVGAGHTVRALPLYETIDTTAPPPEAYEAVLFHSARAATAFARRRAMSGPSLRDRHALALSRAVAQPLRGLGFASLFVADRPTEAALLAGLSPRALGKPHAPV